MFYHLAVPGFCAATVAGEAIRFDSPDWKTQPGTVAQWVACTVCDASWTHDGGYSGGSITARRWNSYTGRVEPLAVACRCSAGSVLGLRSATEAEYRRAVARVRLRIRKGLAIMTDEAIMRYLVEPRGASFAQRWSYHCERQTARGVDSHFAIRRGYVRAFQEVSR